MPGAQPLFDMTMFPVCAPALTRDPARPLRRPEDLRQHVLLDLDTQATRGRWSDWKPWLEAMKLDRVEPAGILRFSHYDQLIHAVIAGSGVGMGRYPHSVSPLREGLLVAPFGREAMLSWGTYSILVAPRSSRRAIVKDFIAWLRDEVRGLR